jgi:myo-inositol-1(or 4)-monophosphatase
MTPPTLPSPSEALAVAVTAAQQGGAIARDQRTSQSVTISQKAARNLVTTADVAAEKAIIATIKTHFPDHKILAEESSAGVTPSDFGVGPVWVIDPIDGTTNYAHGHGHVGVSIGYAVDGTVLAGAVLSPFHGELFTATKGGGAFLNNFPIHVSQTRDLSEALIATGFPYERSNIEAICGRLLRIVRTCRDVRRLGAASLDIAWVACGRLDAYYEETLNPWDGAAGCLIAREAGALVGHFPYDSDTQKRTHDFPGDLMMDNLVVAPPALFDAVMTELSNKA